MLSAHGLQKSFKSYSKEEGFWGSVLGLFHRTYTVKDAVKPFDLEIGRGEFVGLLGPNGAGKTTLMKMFTGIIVPTAGELKVVGHSPKDRAREFRKQVALVMGQKSQLWWDIPAMDSFLLLQRYYEIPAQKFHSRVDELSELLQVRPLLNTHVRKLSLGERMKMELMASLLHEPKIMFLDEPTIGLDLVAQRSIREFLRQYQKAHGTTILLTSHYMADVDALCERIVLILQGAKVFDGSKQDFGRILGREKFVSFQFAKSMDPTEPFWQKFNGAWNTQGTQVELRLPEAELRDMSQLILSNYPVVDFKTEKVPIERVMETLLQRPELLKMEQP